MLSLFIKTVLAEESTAQGLVNAVTKLAFWARILLMIFSHVLRIGGHWR